MSPAFVIALSAVAVALIVVFSVTLSKKRGRN